MIRRFFTLVILLLAIVSTADALVIVVPVKDTIDGGLAAFIDRSVAEARSKNADAIIFHIDTPGGRIDSAVHIKDTILKAGVTTVAFVDKSAISAGSLISIACDSIFMSTGSSIGAATAVDLEGKKASEKIISYFRAQMRATAEAKGRRPDIAEAMVDEQLEVKGISPKGMLLTLTYKEALTTGFADGIYESVDAIVTHLGYRDKTVITNKVNWAENVVRFLTHPIVSSMLMSIGFLGLLIELKTPGWGLGGMIALIALALFFGSHYIVKLASFVELILFVVGAILLILEIFIIPGFGIPGVAGILLILISLFLSLVGKMPSPEEFKIAAYTMGVGFLIAVICGGFVIKFLPKTTLFRKLTLETVESSQEGFESTATDSTLVGAEGTALSDLRPAGKALVNGSRLDVVTQGEYIPKGTAISVIEVHGSRIVVAEGRRQI